ncbi:MAG: DUF6384 family protein [Pseudomonadota bacterium]
MSTPASTKPGLSDVLLAMDVVDTLRHEQRLVATALNAEAREAALIQRVREAYAAQGIDVSDQMIQEGVQALKDRQFEYEPPEPGLRTRFYTAWVRRRRIGGSLMAVGALVGTIWAGYWGFVERPRQQAAEAALVAEQAEAAALAALPDEITRAAEVARSVAKTNDAISAVDVAVRDARNALALNRIEDARQALTELKSLAQFIESDLTLRIVSRSGEMTGVIRAPTNRSNVDNYYIVIEALDRSGRPTAIDIVSEEDGTQRRVSLWGLRVSESTFNQVRADKSDDGIVQANAAGTKPAGAINLVYSLPNLGGTIHSWERR